MTSSTLLTDVAHVPLLLLATILGVAFIGLGGVILVFLMVSPKFITTFSMLLNPNPYSKSESLLLWQHFFLLVSCFLIAFSSLSIFLLKCAKDCFMGSGFFPPSSEEPIETQAVCWGMHYLLAYEPTCLHYYNGGFTTLLIAKLSKHTYLTPYVPTYLLTYVPLYLHTYVIYVHSLVLSTYLCIVPVYLCTYVRMYL